MNAPPARPVTQCTQCGLTAGCKCVFTRESLLEGKPICKKCAGTAQHEEVAEIEAARKIQEQRNH